MVSFPLEYDLAVLVETEHIARLTQPFISSCIFFSLRLINGQLVRGSDANLRVLLPAFPNFFLGNCTSEFREASSQFAV